MSSIKELDMELLTLIIGNKNYSSWSLRPWILLKYFDVPFKEVLILLYEGDYKKRVLEYSDSGKVPALIHGQVKISESLAIMEYVAEIFPDKKMWPADLKERACARGVSHEMHAGFSALRTNMPMNIRGNHPGKGRNADVDRDIARVDAIWSECRKSHAQGKFLFGSFTIADAMFAPVVTRFHTYGIKLSSLAQEYAETIRQLPAMKEWSEAGVKEPYVIAASELYSGKV